MILNMMINNLYYKQNTFNDTNCLVLGLNTPVAQKKTQFTYYYVYKSLIES